MTVPPIRVSTSAISAPGFGGKLAAYDVNPVEI